MAKKKPAAKTRSLAVEDRPIDQVKPYPGNPRRIEDEAVRKVAESIKAYGFRQHLVVDVDGVIVVGHVRYLAAKLLGRKTVPVHVAEDLTPAQVRAYRIADNRLGENSEWDDGKLATEIRQLDVELRDQLGFELEQLDKLLGDAPAPLTPVTVREPPAMAWVLLGVPLVDFGEIAGLVDQASANPAVQLFTTTSDFTGKE